MTLALLTLAVPAGCVRRRLAVRSNPPGAVVFVDNQQIGTTPCSVDFTYYGTREIRLVKPGYETLTVNQPIPTPWYQIPPIDFVSENVLPNKIEDHRTVAFNLEPQIIVPTEQLLERANQLRQETLAGAAALPPQAVVVPGPGAPPMVAPPDTFGPAPTFAPTPAAQPVPLPPVNQSPVDQQPFTQQPFGQPSLTQPPLVQPPYGQTAPPTTVVPSTIPSSSLPPTMNPSTTLPATPQSGIPTGSAPFSPPALPTIAPTTPSAGTQQGPPITSPPLR